MINAGSCIDTVGGGKIRKIACDSNNKFMYEDGFVYKQSKSKTDDSVFKCLTNRKGDAKIRKCSPDLV